MLASIFLNFGFVTDAQKPFNALCRSGRPAIQESWPNNVMWHQGFLVAMQF